MRQTSAVSRRFIPLLAATLSVTATGLHCAGGSSPRPKPAHNLSAIVRDLAAKVSAHAMGRVGIVPFVERRSGERTLAGDYIADFFYPELRDRADFLVDRSFARKAAYNELCQSHSLRVDESTAIGIGRQVAAQSVLTGIITDLRGQGQRLDVRLLEVASGRVLGSAGEFLPPGSVPDDLVGQSPPNFDLKCGLKAASRKPRRRPKADLTVAIRRWGGYAGGVYFNGGLEPSPASRFRSLGLSVRFVLLDSIKESVEAWRRGDVDVMWITVDDLPTEYRDIERERPRLFLQTGWSRGEEVVVARDNINTLNDLKGKRIALEENTTAHSFLLVSLDLAALEPEQVTIVPARNNREAADIFIRGDADAAVVWVDEDERCLRRVDGAHRLETTEDASYLIAESLVVRASSLGTKRTAVERLAQGWLRANAELNADAEARNRAQGMMVRAFRVSQHVAERELALVRLATFGDNQNFFGLDQRYRGETGEHLYEYFRQEYSAIDNKVRRLPAWNDVADTSIVRRVGPRLQGSQHLAEPKPDFSHCRDADEQPLSKKGVSVRFAPDEFHLTPDDERVIDEQFAHLAEIYSHDCIRIDGNTDNRGPLKYNLTLSRKRAESVAAYLKRRYGFDPKRIISVGNGPNRPIDGNDTPDGRRRNRRTDFELLHRPR